MLRLVITLNGQFKNEILTENNKEGNGHDIILWCYPSICLEDLKETMKTLSQDS
jgi:hypothetical protein